MNLNLKLRNIDNHDINDLFKWRNHHVVREKFFNTSLITWDEHKKWFDTKSKGKDTTIYIVYSDENKIGSIITVAIWSGNFLNRHSRESKLL